MYSKTLTKIVNVRMTEKMYEWIEQESENYGIKPSDFIRMILNIAKEDFENERRIEDEVQ